MTELNNGHVGHVLAMTPKLMSRTEISASLTDPVSHVLRTPVLNIMKRKPCLHDGTVTVHVNTYKNRLVEIPPSSGESPNDGLTRFSKHLELNHHE